MMHWTFPTLPPLLLPLGTTCGYGVTCSGHSAEHVNTLTCEGTFYCISSRCESNLLVHPKLQLLQSLCSQCRNMYKLKVELWFLIIPMEVHAARMRLTDCLLGYGCSWGSKDWAQPEDMVEQSLGIASNLCSCKHWIRTPLKDRQTSYAPSILGGGIQGQYTFVGKLLKWIQAQIAADKRC